MHVDRSPARQLLLSDEPGQVLALLWWRQV